MSLAIETRGLARRFGDVRAVDGIDLEVPTGSVFGFLGPNGSGKTTTIRLLLGLLRPSAGAVRLLGDPVVRGASVVARVGALVERPAFYPFLSARDNLALFGATAGRDPRELEVRIPDLLARVGLAEAAGRGVGGFSTGMRQRLGLALAMLGEPELLVLDEPTNGLDPAGVVEVRALLTSLASQGVTIFLSTHVLTEVEQLCDRVAVLQRGRIVAQQATAELLGGGRGYRLRFDDAPTLERARALLVEEGLVATANPDDGLDVLAPADAGSRIARILATGGVYPSELSPARSTLEAAFLELTGSGDAR